MTEHTQNTIQTKKALTVNEVSEYTGIGRNNLRDSPMNGENPLTTRDNGFRVVIVI